MSKLDIIEFVEKLAYVGSHYQMEEMEKLYTEDLGFLVLNTEGGITRFSKKQMLDEFRSRRDGGERPLLTEKKILHIEEKENEATVVLYRKMSDLADPAFYELRLVKVAHGWLVKGETVLPWPQLENAKGFPPPRS